ncbi:DinB family protein [Geodermatophilus sp. URMC 63]
MTDDRLPPLTAAGERATLIAVLERQRATLAWKCHGLDDQQLRTRAVPPSGLSLLWLVRHATEVERSWFRRVMQADDEPAVWEVPADAGLGDEEMTGPQAFDRWEREVGRSRAFVSAAASLDVVGAHLGEQYSLRYVLLHVIEEYARHNGHADLLRERVDGATGE